MADFAERISMKHPLMPLIRAGIPEAM